MSFESLENPEQLSSEENAPRFYSKQAILGFSIFFSPLFGGVLLMQNLSKLNDRKGRMQVLVFCIAYIMAVVVAVNIQAKPDSNITFFLNSLGAAWLLFYWWPKFISPELKYYKKSVWKALLVSVLIVIPFVLFFISQTGAV